MKEKNLEGALATQDFVDVVDKNPDTQSSPAGHNQPATSEPLSSAEMVIGKKKEALLDVQLQHALAIVRALYSYYRMGVLPSSLKEKLPTPSTKRVKVRQKAFLKSENTRSFSHKGRSKAEFVFSLCSKTGFYEGPIVRDPGCRNIFCAKK